MQSELTRYFILQAEEVSQNKRSEIAELKIEVQATNQFAPEIGSSIHSFEGYVPENVRRNTYVTDELGAVPLRLLVSDRDQVGIFIFGIKYFLSFNLLLVSRLIVF